jgi:serine/threonine-protein kinase
MLPSWEENWILNTRQAIKRMEGGQGTIDQVSHKIDGRLGALKRLHEKYMNSKERRFRVLEEVSALLLLDGNGTPKIYEANEKLWETENIPLYAVMEWVEGKTLSQHLNGKELPLDTAFEFIYALLQLIDSCHNLKIYHRDLKPDNIILRNNNILEPVLVDFGMAWCSPSNEEKRNLSTMSGQELGNRFFRLPE